MGDPICRGTDTSGGTEPSGGTHSFPLPLPAPLPVIMRGMVRRRIALAILCRLAGHLVNVTRCSPTKKGNQHAPVGACQLPLVRLSDCGQRIRYVGRWIVRMRCAVTSAPPGRRMERAPQSHHAITGPEPRVSACPIGT